MANTFESFKDLDLTREEVEKFGDALKNKEFRKLLCDYVDEIRNPENQKIYQQEITQLEKERGYDITFINPSAGYVIKTSLNGTKKCFINICKNDNITKPSSKRTVQDGRNGLNWSLPYSLAPPREDVDKKGLRCQVFDVVFHPDTLYLAANNKAFLNMVNSTACNAVESNFNVKLDCKNLKFPKMQYKGMAHPAIIRQKSQSKPEQMDPEAQALMDKLYDTLPKVEERIPNRYKVKKDDIDSKYTTPTYTIKHRSSIELEQFTEDRNCKLNCTVPKELIIEINLPLLKSANDITLDVTEKTVQLSSEKPSKYKLELTLPYSVNQDTGNAKFDQELKKLTVTLPVKRKGTVVDISRDDSGVESDHGSPMSSPTEFSNQDLITVLSDNLPQNIENESKVIKNDFLDLNTHYTFPDFTSHLFENILTITLQVRNVDETSLERMISQKSLHVKFSTISSGFYPVYYAFYLELNESNQLEKEKLSIEVWDNNVIIQIPFTSHRTIRSYYVGLTTNNLEEKFLNDPTPSTSLLSEDNPSQQPQHHEENRNSKKKCKRAKNVQIETEKLNEDENKPAMSKAIDIEGAVSESSGDELSYSYSPIDGEISSSLKKTVRFNDVVLKQLYRSNSSILGQKKKNQRKARNKKRAQERRHSESELSELDELKERDSKTNEQETNNGEESNEVAVDEESEANDIFDLDI